jgi:hypothetical protein
MDSGKRQDGSDAPGAQREQLKQARERRGSISARFLEEMKAHNKTQRAVLSSIATSAKTVPEIARETGLPSNEVFWWITALRKYGRVQDEGKRGDYTAYLRSGEPPGSAC